MCDGSACTHTHDLSSEPFQQPTNRFSTGFPAAQSSKPPTFCHDRCELASTAIASSGNAASVVLLRAPPRLRISHSVYFCVSRVFQISSLRREGIGFDPMSYFAIIDPVLQTQSPPAFPHQLASFKTSPHPLPLPPPLYTPNGTPLHSNPSPASANCPLCTSAQRGASFGMVVAPPALATLASVLWICSEGRGEVRVGEGVGLRVLKAETVEVREEDADAGGVKLGEVGEDLSSASSLKAGWKIAMPGFCYRGFLAIKFYG